MKKTLPIFYRENYLEQSSGKANAKKIIALIVEKNDNYSPCAYIRIILPSLNKYRYERVVLVSIDVDELIHYRPDEIITHRIAIKKDKIKLFFESIRKYNIPFIYDLDDDLLEIPYSEHPESKFYSIYTDLIKALIINAKTVTVSTEVLKRKLDKFRIDVSVVKNYLSSQLWGATTLDPFSTNNKFNVLYMGTNTHHNDFGLVKEAFKNLKKNHKDIVLNIIGITDCRKTEGVINFIEIPPKAKDSYPLFVSWLKSLGKFDLAIAPLIENTFNSSKSDIKYIEYTALGMAVIASDVEPFKSSIQNRINGILVKNETKYWINEIVDCYSNSILRINLLTEAKKLMFSRIIS